MTAINNIPAMKFVRRDKLNLLKIPWSQVGFNAGNGTRSYEYKPYSQVTTVRDLTSRGWANGFPGRHIFRIDENIILGNCNKDTCKNTKLV